MASYKKYQTKKGTKWKFRVFVGHDQSGKQIIKTGGGFDTKKEAVAAAVDYENQLHRNGFTNNKNLTFKEVYEQWFESYKLTVKESTWTTTERNFDNHILPIFETLKISEITPVFCQKVVNDWYNKPLRNYKRFLNNISSVFAYAVRLKIITENPTLAVIRPSAMTQEQPHKKAEKDMYYTKDELQEFLRCIYDNDNPQGFTFFRLLAFTGARKGEMLALQWRDINFKDNSITINKTQSNGAHSLLVQTPKTAASNRIIYVDPKTMEILKKWQTIQRKELLIFGYNSMNPDQLVFTSQKNQMHNPNKPRTWMINVTNKYDLKHIPVHGFRHTYATLAIQGGMPPKQLQIQLGHSNIQTTLDIYTAVTDQQKKDTPELFTKLVDF